MTAAPKTNVSPLDIKIVGAGMAGLSAAISCALAGHNVVVLEGARELAEVGAGFQVTPNGCRVLQQYGLLEDLRRSAAEPTLLQVRRWSDGKVLSRTDDFNVEMKSKYNAPFWDLHRVDVQRALAAKAKELGVEVRLGSRIEDVDFDQATIRLASGETLQADLIVGADGLWSKCRQKFLMSKGLEPDIPIPTGDLAYRIVLEVNEVKSQEVKDWISQPTCQFWIGPEAHVVAYSVRNGQMINIVLLVPDNLPPDVSKQSGSLEEMRAIFNHWDPMLNRFLDEVKSVEKWKLMHGAELDSWISPKSNFVFVGDACHSMLPYLAQGANSAIEDGAVLGNILTAVESRSQLPAALKLHEQLRKKRGEAIVRETFAQRKDFHMPDGEEQAKRDELMLGQLGKQIEGKFPSRWQCPEVQPWLYGYDAKEEVERALKAQPLASVSA
ncbi:FAD-dependent monooxygenase OpS4 [Fulvia fulva]|uniref:FAD-dependent monooxygenase OpS4 n=1 Tax=Passalora fulva TaxID=5499 RepID=A0A9Q8LER3_PASFU|nr:FAD-dependent monooxygenase OpS4 [Fulvia fulva]KAK4615668.1 FAD-dependent monooxygenase OpS4 [Fulvia fulva]KAK4616583.1 FAD-dependent monooxygenase OpS4 [Fulvia fulva]UJO16054.1 FAD-dependent monooxygenase OpS4 [Fulvia fulva]WPV19087.1 FAD-dependent monooxygenase OpS4 [Fulvia fulva]WPV34521.1 FAD-dependent monooxygenase OpS4 [Fulvia fulva]